MSIWNSTFKNPGKPMKRSGIRTLVKPSARKPVKAKWFKTAKPKMTPIRKSAKEKDCTLRFPGICRNRTETTVWCHSNSLEDGKGMGLKARDEEGCYGCFECHSFLDGGWVYRAGWTREMVDEVFNAAREESQVILRHEGLL